MRDDDSVREAEVGDTGGVRLDVRELPLLLARIHADLAEHREAIDELNVFPVPDGDTGTNMTLTIRAALDELHAVDDPGAGARAAVRGAIRGARGNSGVILSQVVRALVEVVADTGARAVDAAGYADALDRARALAYRAVAEPVEGTILTVIAAAAVTAREAAGASEDLVAVSRATCDTARAAVERTPEQLPALADAGVVDAGARGLEVLLAAVHAHLTGETAPEMADTTPSPRPHREPGNEDLSHRFEVQYLLDADDDAAEPLRRRLEVLGDSVVVVGAGGLLNVHVHTDDVGGAIEEGLRVGRPSDIEVTHFGDELAERRAARGAAVGAVAVLDGPGARALAAEHGAVVVPGAAGALPAVADLLNALGQSATERVVVLPGHPDVVPTARQTVEVARAEGGRPIEVLEAADSLCAVLAALSVLDPAGPVDLVLRDMREAVAAVASGDVVPAVRDAETPIGRVRGGQPLILVAGDVRAAAEEPLEALGRLCDELGVADGELVTLLLGAAAPPGTREPAEQLVRARAGGEVLVLDTGHPHACWSVGVE